MGPISAVNVNPTAASFQASPATRPAADAAGSGSAAGGVQIASASVVSSSLSITNVHNAVGSLLQSIDADLANNKMLRMLIGLMILLALLQNSQSKGEEAGQELGNPGSASRTQFLGVFSSSTTVQIQQSVSTALAVEVTGAFGSSASQPESSGGQVDVSA